jgi:hypothetical protein
MSQTSSNNPLKGYFRQPKIYLTLPSQGKYYPPTSIELTETGELPVYAMTARDEITFKTPDALLNGQATVDVIQSCIPNIKNAWHMPSLDLDAALIAIRIATYGEQMDVNAKIPNIDEEKTYQVDLRNILDSLVNNSFEDTIVIDDLVIHLKPLTYYEFTQSALKTFEEQRVFQIVNNENITEEEKLKRFNQSFKKLTELTVGMVTNSIQQIDVNDESVTDPAHLAEFIQNADQKFYTKITEHIEKQKEKFSVKPMTVYPEPEEQEQGAPESFEVPIMFDQSNFFAREY